MKKANTAAVIGAGPAGLMAAEVLSAGGAAVTVYDAMPSFGRKFLMAGKSGLNITHTEPEPAFLSRYICADPRLVRSVSSFGAADIIHWMAGLGIERHTGSTGRVFPAQMKASPLLRAWLSRLERQSVAFMPRHRWTGWSEAEETVFETPDGARPVLANATVLALGGKSWSRLGANGTWADILQDRRVSVEPFSPSNCGFLVNWSEHFKTRYAGAPVKAVRLSVGQSHNSARGEFVITSRGVESGGIYTLSAALREQLQNNKEATLQLDLAPDIALETLQARLSKPRGKQSLSNHLRKTAGLSPVKRGLVFEFASKSVLDDPLKLASFIKSIPVPIVAPAPIDEAISTAGGVSWAELDDAFMLRQMPGVFCAGEMLDWDAPTGGYLITACLGTGRAAGQGALNWLNNAQRA